MERLNQYSFAPFFSFIISSALLSFALCLAAEFKKTKKNHLRIDGDMCYLPGSSAFGLGIAALISLSIAQVIGSVFICRKFRSKDHICKIRKPTVPCILLVFSWMSFGIAFVLISGATSMSRSQHYGEGWLDGECYLVKDGIYAGSAVLAMLALGSTLGSVGIRIRGRQQTEENTKVHSQVVDE